ncbi:hypothetical protein AB1L42_23755 [Thalassoglobus sp. JC818]|uniref:hypothetical protein n=1 Tax=Thalassoglobus sp. JC818 TaxID=3232136 RepID=UPI0034587F8E
MVIGSLNNVLLEKFLFFVVSCGPVTVIVIGLLFVEERDTTSADRWCLGEKDPFRFVIYDTNRNIRPWVRPVALLAGSAYVAVMIYFVATF